jgi:hypothetical protein
LFSQKRRNFIGLNGNDFPRIDEVPFGLLDAALDFNAHGGESGL